MSEKKAVASAVQKKSFAELYSKYGTFTILILVMIIGTIASPKFLTLDNMSNVIRQNSYLLIIAFGTTFVMVVGCINIAYDNMLALVGCASCLLYVGLNGNLVITVLASLLLGALLGLIYGFLVTHFNLPPFMKPALCWRRWPPCTIPPFMPGSPVQAAFPSQSHTAGRPRQTGV